MQILIVVVRYKMSLDHSETIAGISRTFKAHPELFDFMSVLIWDNSPSKLEKPELSFPFEYRHLGENLGVSGAYNHAMKIAEANGVPWMLLLDQDTTLTDNFLSRMLNYSKEQEGNCDIATIAPFLLDGNRPISPLIIHATRVKPMSIDFSGVNTHKSFAANSGCMMRVSALAEVHGYDENFWLDLSDVVVFHRLYKSDKKIYVAGDLRLQHKITNNDYDGSMSPERYRNFITAEGAYWDLYRSKWENSIQTGRLLARSIKQYHRYANKRFSRITWSYFFERLFTSKNVRLRRWKEQSRYRNIPDIYKGKVVG